MPVQVEHQSSGDRRRVAEKRVEGGVLASPTWPDGCRLTLNELATPGAGHVDCSTTCSHPMGFTVVKDGHATCFDCKAASPGRCVCGALYRTMVCQGRAHLKGARLEAEVAR